MYSGNENIVVLGAGVSGVAACRLAFSKESHVTLYDQNVKSLASPACQELSGQGVLLQTGAYEKLQGPYDLAILSPGVPNDSPLAIYVSSISRRTVSELAYGASFIQAPMLAVTGTNGKTTTVEMLAHCLASAGKRTIAAGNIGLPLSQIALEGSPMDAVVVEVSSFQLELADNFHPWAAALLNITPDHLVRHGTMERYTQTKLEIFRNIMEPARCFTTPELSHLVPGCTTFSAEKNVSVDYSANLLTTATLPFTGRHNIENALAAMALASSVGVTREQCLQALRSFRTGDHRLQTVACARGYTFIDDSKATNVDALIQALAAVRIRPLALIAGGLDKGCTLEEALPHLKKYVSHVSLIGSCKERLMKDWGKELPCCPCGTMDEAVHQAINALPQGGCVLLSPACASQDMYRDYIQRGDEFAQCAKNCF